MTQTSTMLRQMVNREGITLLPNLLLDAYHYYRLSNDEVLLLLHLLRCQDSDSGSKLSLSDFLCEKMRRTRSEINYLISSLQKKGFLSLQTDAGKLKAHEVSLHLLYSNLVFWQELPTKEKQGRDESEHEQLVHLFERTFSHLNVMEYERLRQWLDEDNWPPEVIKEALRIAALNKALSITYIDRILLNWQEEGLSTLEEVLAAKASHLSRRKERSEAPEGENRREFRSLSKRRSERPTFVIGSINQVEETAEERRKRFERLIE